MTELSICSDTRVELKERWIRIRHGGFQFLHMHSRPGSGNRQLIRGFQNEVALECITWHAQFLTEETNIHIIPKLLNGLWKGIRQHSGKTKIVLRCLGTALQSAATTEDQKQIQSLIDSLRASQLSEGEQIIMSDNRPIRALIQLAKIVAEKFRLLILLEDLQVCHCITPYVWLDALLSDLPINVRLMVICTSETESRSVKALPQGLQFVYQKHHFESVSPKPWLPNRWTDVYKELPVQEVPIEWWSEGLPGRVIEIINLLKENIPQEWLQNKPLKYKDRREQSVLESASLFGFRFPVSLIAIANDMSIESCRQVLQEAKEYVQLNASGDLRNEYWSFHSVTQQLKIRSNTISDDPDRSYQTSVLYEKQEGVKNKALLFALLDTYAQMENEDAILRIHQLLHSAESDLSWLHLADICIGHKLEWPSNILGTALIAGLRYLYVEDVERAKRMFRWSMQWSIENQKSRVAIEVIRLHTRYLIDQNDVSMAQVAIKDALEIAQQTNDPTYTIGLNLDLAEIYFSQNQLRECKITLNLIPTEAVRGGSYLRYRMLSAHVDMSEKNFKQAETTLEQARNVAKKNGMLRSATDLGLLRVEALLANSDINDATSLHKILEGEVQMFPARLKRWEKLKKEIIARA